MLTEQQRAFLKVLDLVEEAGCIDHVILIGSWAEFAYRQAGNLAAKVSINPQNTLSSKPTHQEVDCRDDFDAVDVGRMAPPANDNDLLITTGDLLERPELKWTQLALARRLLVSRLCNLDVTKGNQLLEISRFSRTVQPFITRPNLQVFLMG